MDKVVYLDVLKREFRASATIEITNIYAGFSERFNFFIDLSDIEVPQMHNGRVSFIAQLMSASRPAVSDWLSKDKPPKETSLFEIVSYFLNHIDQGEELLIARVVAWLKYGDEVSSCPFQIADQAEDYQTLIPLAATLIADEAKALGIRASSYNLESVLSLTVNMLLGFELKEISDIEKIHRLITQQHIKSHAR